MADFGDGRHRFDRPGAVFFDCAPVPASMVVDEPALESCWTDPLVARSAAKHSAGVLV